MKRIRKHSRKHQGYNTPIEEHKFKEDPRCIRCDIRLCYDKTSDDYNWRHAQVVRHHYVCGSCKNQESKSYTLKKTAKEISKEYVARFNEVKDGYVYIITNPAWEGWIKIGMAVHPEDRCNNYQTSSPFRDFKVCYTRYFKNRLHAERIAHSLVANRAEESIHEWFKISVDEAKHIIKSI
tara:strand:+ start:73 stop:612 length:540 start_codon:yes stop_codon:yes gene_type:complete